MSRKRKTPRAVRPQRQDTTDYGWRTVYRLIRGLLKWVIGAAGAIVVSVIAYNANLGKSSVFLGDHLFYHEGAESTSRGGIFFGGELLITKTRGTPLKACTIDVMASRSRNIVDNFEGTLMVSDRDSLSPISHDYAVVELEDEEGNAEPFDGSILDSRAEFSGRLKYSMDITVQKDWQYLAFAVLCDGYRSPTLWVERPRADATSDTDSP